MVEPNPALVQSIPNGDSALAYINGPDVKPIVKVLVRMEQVGEPVQLGITTGA